MSADCIVVGAGPAGSMAARELSERGFHVLLVDRYNYPRDKPCGGGVLVSAAAQLPFSLNPVVERVTDGFRVTYRRGQPFGHRFDSPLAYMTQRALLDAFLVERACASGVQFQDGRKVDGIDLNEDSATVQFDNGERLCARTIVAADGANGVVRRFLGFPPFRQAIALEANIDGVQPHWFDQVGLDLGSMPGGYGWVFPKGDHLNLGVGGWPITGPNLRGELDSYANALGFDAASLHNRRGHSLPLRDFDSPLYKSCVVFVGDAAGLVDPLSGEGIGNAFHSGRLAAMEIDKLLRGEVANLAGYAKAVQSEIAPSLAVSRQFQVLFHQFPWFYTQLLRRSGRFWKTFCHIVRGESDFASFKGQLGPFSLILDGVAWQAQRGVGKHTGWN